jgi:DNA-binding transcriptional LysR family regulator
MVSDIPYPKLKVFYHVARCGGYSRAAAVLCITKGAVSMQVNDLEQRLGRQLFDRSNRKTVLTPHGVNLFDLVAPIVERCESIGLEFEKIAGKIKGEVKIASWTGLLLHVLPKYVTNFRETYPECDIVLINTTGKEIRSLLLAGDVDFSIGSMATVSPEIIGKELWRFHRYCIAPLGHPLSKRKKVTFEDLAKYPIVMADREGTGGIYLERMLRACNPNLRVTMEAASWEVVMKYVEMGMGVSMAPAIVFQPKDKKRMFFCDMTVSDERVGYSRHGILIKKGKYLSPAAEEFIRSLSSNVNTAEEFLF